MDTNPHSNEGGVSKQTKKNSLVPHNKPTGIKLEPRRANIPSPIQSSSVSPLFVQGASPISASSPFSLDPNAATFAPAASQRSSYLSPSTSNYDQFSDSVQRLSLNEDPSFNGMPRPPRPISSTYSGNTFGRSPQNLLAPPGVRQSQLPPPIATNRSFQTGTSADSANINSPSSAPGSRGKMQSIWQGKAYSKQPVVAYTSGFPFSALTPAPGFLERPQSAVEASAQYLDYPSPGSFDKTAPKTPASAIGSYGLFSGRHPISFAVTTSAPTDSSSKSTDSKTPGITSPSILTLPPIERGQFIFPARPDNGMKGRKIRVRANFFEFLTLPGQMLYHYDIKIVPEVPPSLNRKIFREMMMKHGGVELGNAMAVFDGRRNIYTPVSIQLLEENSILELEILLSDETSPASSVSTVSGKSIPSLSPPRRFMIRLKQCPMINMECLNEFIASVVPSHSPPFDALQALDVLMRHRPSMLLTTVGRSFFTRNDARPLGDGAECWMGFHQNVKPAQGKVVINIDVSATAFFEPGPILNFIAKNLGKKTAEDLFNSLRHREVEKCERLLKGVKIQVNHRGDIKRKYKIHGFTRTSADQTFFKYSRNPDSSSQHHLGLTIPNQSFSASFSAESMFLSKQTLSVSDANLPQHKSENEIEISVSEYFFRQYNSALKFPHLPCLKVGNSNRCVYLPLEVCDVVPGQRFMRKLNESQTAQMIRLTCQTPDRRANKIANSISELGLSSLGPAGSHLPEVTKSMAFDPEDEAYLASFGVKISDEMMTVPARVLDPPTIQYHPSSREPVITPKEGSWNLRDKRVVQPATLHSWSVVCFGTPREMPQHKIDHFLRELIHTCKDTGLIISNPHPPAIYGDSMSNIENTLQSAWQAAGEATQAFPQLILCVLPNTGVPLYAEIKRVGDTVLGVPTQCVQVKHTFQPKKQYCANVCLKINSKLGGINSFIIKNPHNSLDEGLPWIGEVPTIIFGADVTHPAHGESRTTGSVCALVGSLDRMASRYSATVRLQPPRQEVMVDLSSMVQELLRIFHSENSQTAPQRILFYRDGISESQFYDVVTNELAAIRDACEKILPNYRPAITYVVVQKRHHARVFAMNPKDADRSGNIPAGTVIDSHITHPNEYDFYLCSHAGLQGTSRPTHYHVLHDENNFSPDILQDLTYRLCYSYARCTRSVSVVPPAYYADLVAFRAKYHMKSSLIGWSTTGSVSGKEDSLTSGTNLDHNDINSVPEDDDSSRNGRRKRREGSFKEEDDELMKKLQSRLAKVKSDLQRVMYWV